MSDYIIKHREIIENREKNGYCDPRKLSKETSTLIKQEGISLFFASRSSDIYERVDQEGPISQISSKSVYALTFYHACIC